MKIKPRKIEIIHEVNYKGIDLVRTEEKVFEIFRWENETELQDVHTIRWSKAKEDEIYEDGYFTSDKGWSKNGILDKKNPTPPYEREFQKKFKVLFNFNLSKLFVI